MPHEYDSGVHDRPAWHGLGRVLGRLFSTAEALHEGGLVWSVVKEQQERGGVPIPGRYWTIRTDVDRVLGVVGETYRVVQNATAFDWMDTLLGGEGFHYTQAVSLRGGAVIALTAEAPFEIDLPTSRGKLYVVLMNPHDGTGSLQAIATPVQVVCANTLRSALRTHEAVVRIRHTTNAEQKLAQAQRVLGLSRGAAELVARRGRELFRRPLTDRDFAHFLKELVPLRAGDPSRTAETRVANVRTAISAIYSGGDFGQPDMRGTAWGAYNAVVAYHDHSMGGNNTRVKSAAENVFERILSGDNIGSRALALLS